MPTIRSYRDLIVWQKAMDLGVMVLDLAVELQHPRYFALTDQLRRAALSVPANIAEGYGRHSRRDYGRFIAIANGSIRALETILRLLARHEEGRSSDLGPLLRLADEASRMLTALHRRLLPRRPTD